MLRPPSVQPGQGRKHPCRLIVFPRYEAGSELRVESISPAQAALI